MSWNLDWVDGLKGKEDNGDREKIKRNSVEMRMEGRRERERERERERNRQTDTERGKERET